VFNQRFPGQYYDEESGLHYNYFRDYDPATGRYVESDPIGLAGGISLYSYGYANPLFYQDPLGLWGLNPRTAAWLSCYLMDAADDVANSWKDYRRRQCEENRNQQRSKISESCESNEEQCRDSTRYQMTRKGSFEQECYLECLRDFDAQCMQRIQRAEDEYASCMDRVGSNMFLGCDTALLKPGR
jgi:RHS repeat-associated protein